MWERPGFTDKLERTNEGKKILQIQVPTYLELQRASELLTERLCLAAD